MFHGIDIDSKTASEILAGKWKRPLPTPVAAPEPVAPVAEVTVHEQWRAVLLMLSRRRRLSASERERFTQLAGMMQ